MAKNMALIDNGIVANILWCSDRTAQTETLIDLEDRPVGIGDTFADGKFYRGGEVVMTPLEAALAEVEAIRAENDDMKSALEILEVTPDENVE